MGKIINEIKHMYMNDDNNLKKKSLEDNVYFTLRDIFWNSNSVDVSMIANEYSSKLTRIIIYEERIDSFQYTNILYRKKEIEKLLKWLHRITPVWFEILELEDGEKIIKKDYMAFDDWWKQFEELRELLREHYEKICA